MPTASLRNRHGRARRFVVPTTSLSDRHGRARRAIVPPATFDGLSDGVIATLVVICLGKHRKP